MEDWDLQAVVRECNYNNNEVYNFSQACFDDPFSCIQENNDPFQDLNCFLESTRVNFTELEQLIYRPFSPTLHSHMSTPTMLTSSMSAPKDQVQREEKLKNITKSISPAKSCKKSRRNQQKREVKHVTEEGLCSDKWAWRKYGQKPIKGSAYPRSYYRCSSSKGCSARKQVERSHLNPEMFIITYTAQHAHAHPATRSSLAGTTRKKFPADSKTNKQSNLGSANTNLDDHDHVQATSIIKIEKDDIDQEIDEQTSELDLQNDGFMDHFSDDFLSSWLSSVQFVSPEL